MNYIINNIIRTYVPSTFVIMIQSHFEIEYDLNFDFFIVNSRTSPDICACDCVFFLGSFLRRYFLTKKISKCHFYHKMSQVPKLIVVEKLRKKLILLTIFMDQNRQKPCIRHKISKGHAQNPLVEDQRPHCEISRLSQYANFFVIFLFYGRELCAHHERKEYRRNQ